MAEVKSLTTSLTMETVHTTAFFCFFFLHLFRPSDVSSVSVPTNTAQVFFYRTVYLQVCVCACVCLYTYQYAGSYWVYKEKPSSVSCTQNAPLPDQSEISGCRLQQNTEPVSNSPCWNRVHCDVLMFGSIGTHSFLTKNKNTILSSTSK